MKKRTFFTLFSLTLFALACGQHPLGLFGQINSAPSFGVLLSSGNTITSPYSSSVPYLTFNASSGSILVPEDGFITAFGNDGTYAYVDIYHNARFSSRIGIQLNSYFQSFTQQVGQSLTKGQSLKDGYLGGLIRFQIQDNGRIVCPIAYFSENARTQIASYSSNPCQ